MSSRWVAAAVVLALVFGQSVVATAAPILDDRPDAMDAFRGTQCPHVQAKLKSGRPDPRRQSGWQHAAAPPPHGVSIARPNQLSIVETALAARVHGHAGTRTAVARGPPAA